MEVAAKIRREANERRDAALQLGSFVSDIKAKEESLKAAASDSFKTSLIEKEKGNALFKKGLYKEAVKCYSKSINFDNSNPVLYVNRAMAYLKLGSFVEAEMDCTKGLNIDPKNVKAHWRRGVANKGLKQYQKAKTDLKNALVLEPTNKSIKQELDSVLSLLEPLSSVQTKSNTTPKTSLNSNISNSNTTPMVEKSKRRRVTIKEIGDPKDYFLNKSDKGKENDGQLVAVESKRFFEKSQSPEQERRKKQVNPPPPPQALSSSSSSLPPQALSSSSSSLPPQDEASFGKPSNSLSSPKRKMEVHDIVSSYAELDDISVIEEQAKELPPLNTTTKSARKPPPLIVDITEQEPEKVNEPMDLKDKKETTKQKSKTTPPPPPVPKTMYEFELVYKMISNDEGLYEFLKTIPPESLPKIFQESLEERYLSRIFRVINKYYKRDNETELAKYTMECLSKCKRLGVVLLFMDRKDLDSILEWIKDPNLTTKWK